MPGGWGVHRTIKEHTVVVDVKDNINIPAREIIDSIQNVVGEGAVLAIVPKTGNAFEITLSDQNAIDLIVDTGFEHKDKTYKPRAIFSKMRVVSFFNVSHYTPDDEITDKLEALGIELKSPLQRKVYDNTKVADGTRYVLCKFPENLKSLPYSMKVSTGIDSHEYIRVTHDHQKKVCGKCLEEGHVYAQCPDNICFKCGKNAHLARFCKTPPCEKCNKNLAKCKCGSFNDENATHSKGPNWAADKAQTSAENDGQQSDAAQRPDVSGDEGHASKPDEASSQDDVSDGQKHQHVDDVVSTHDDDAMSTHDDDVNSTHDDVNSNHDDDLSENDVNLEQDQPKDENVDFNAAVDELILQTPPDIANKLKNCHNGGQGNVSDTITTQPPQCQKENNASSGETDIIPDSQDADMTNDEQALEMSDTELAVAMSQHNFRRRRLVNNPDIKRLKNLSKKKKS